MFSDAVSDAMNEQIKNEFYSAYLYLAMSAQFEAANLPGFAHWMRLQADEEMEHGMKFFDYINERGGRVSLEAIDRPQKEWESALEMFEAALQHEERVSGMINRIYEIAEAEKDYASQVMLNWFVEEQVEEEKSAGEIVELLKMVGDSDSALFLLDRQMAQRAEE